MKHFITTLLLALLTLTTLASPKNVLIIDELDNHLLLEQKIESILDDMGKLGDVDRTQNKAEFNSLALLQAYDLVVFPDLFSLTFTQQSIFETYLDNGGHTTVIGAGTSAYDAVSWLRFNNEVVGFHSDTKTALTLSQTLIPSLLGTLNNSLLVNWLPLTNVYIETYCNSDWYTLYETTSQKTVIYNEYGTSRRATIALDIDYGDANFSQLARNLIQWICDGGNLPIEFAEPEVIAEVQPKSYFINHELVIEGDYPARETINITLYGMNGALVYSHNYYNLTGEIRVPIQIPSGTYVALITDARRGTAFASTKIIKRY